MLARRLGIALTLLLSLLAGPAAGQASANDAAAAQALWDEGRDLARAGDFEAACPKFAASQELDPQLGTLMNLGDCYARIGKNASAWARFVEAAEIAKKREDPREAEARRRAAELEPKLAKLRVVVSQPVEGLTVKRGEVKMSEAQWDTELPIDPGEHRIVASAPGYEPWETTLTIDEEGASQDLEIPALTPLPEDEKGGGDTTVVTEPYDATPVIVAGAVVGGVGLIGLAVGAAFAVIAQNKDDESLAFCDPNDPTLCRQEGVDLREEAHQSQTISIVSFVAGGVLTITGAALILTGLLMDGGGGEGDEEDVVIAPTFSPGSAGLMLHGRF